MGLLPRSHSHQGWDICIQSVSAPFIPFTRAEGNLARPHRYQPLSHFHLLHSNSCICFTWFKDGLASSTSYHTLHHFSSTQTPLLTSLLSTSSNELYNPGEHVHVFPICIPSYLYYCHMLCKASSARLCTDTLPCSLSELRRQLLCNSLPPGKLCIPTGMYIHVHVYMYVDTIE